MDSILHVVASSGDNEMFLESARVIHSKAKLHNKHPLDVVNDKGDTPLHCAARAGGIHMVSQLIDLARAEGGGDGDARVQAVLRKKNKRGETALHEALRLADVKMVKAMVDRLMLADSELARHGDGTSPLYLAVSLEHYDIAKQLHEKDKELSYSGPDGQNVLHAAVLRSIEMTDTLLQWDKDLIKQGDGISGITPLHFAAAATERLVRGSTVIRSLINSDRSSAYQRDKNGSLPIHVAAMGSNNSLGICNYKIVRVFLEECPGCAELRDAQGRTFLHVAVDYNNSILVWLVAMFYVRRQETGRFAAITNMQDDEGNTVLHRAVLAGSLMTFYCLLWNKEIQLNLPNNKGQTPLDLSQTPPIPLLYRLFAGGKYGAHSRENHGPKTDENSKEAEKSSDSIDQEKQAKKLTSDSIDQAKQAKRLTSDSIDLAKEEKNISDSITTLGVVSALLVTVSFAAAFTIPGGYRSTEERQPIVGAPLPAGTPILAKDDYFEGFVVGNNLSLLCAALATISLVYAGWSEVYIRMRMSAFVFSIFFIHSSIRSLAAAFALGTYTTLAPVARATAILTWMGMTFTFLDVAGWVCMTAAGELVLLLRLCTSACFKFAEIIVSIFLWAFWPYIIILGTLAYYKIYTIQ
ncbi:protein ACCELERATED CELL DEATH 6-like [Phragmites australis]|uniref:protein ACCELERATED CELL DEATH 6-like n=1 Tax=Phragmites australis TaxID=29695 RepID=UPI002D7684CD|nr:protein ACCELERATED CELL DEATH 6-like [Phragmites australis]